MTNDRREVTDLIARLYVLLDEGRYDELEFGLVPEGLRYFEPETGAAL